MNWIESKDSFDVLIGNERLLERRGVIINEKTKELLMKEREQARISVVVAIEGIEGRGEGRGGKERDSPVIAGDIVAIISIADKVKKEASLAVFSLRQRGKRVILLTGDNATTAEATARQVREKRGMGKERRGVLQVGISEVFAQVLPNQKQAKVRERERKREREGITGGIITRRGRECCNGWRWSE